MDKPLNWKELPEDKQKELQTDFQRVKKLQEFSNKANQKLFVFLFGEHMGQHYWEKFVLTYKRDICAFIGYIDDEPASVLFTNIFYQKDPHRSNPLYAHCN